MIKALNGKIRAEKSSCDMVEDLRKRKIEPAVLKYCVRVQIHWSVGYRAAVRFPLKATGSPSSTQSSP